MPRVRVTSLLLQIRRCRQMRWQCKVWIQSNNKRTQCTLQLRGPERLSFGVLWNTLENKGTISSKNSTTLRTDTVTSTPGASANDRPKNVGIVIEESTAEDTCGENVLSSDCSDLTHFPLPNIRALFISSAN
uniref:Uncharacterized protein n=1 Tax=Knipowitschia caucasica TaxID=637954 RepID=A0AAV2K8I1_KNICA